MTDLADASSGSRSGEASPPRCAVRGLGRTYGGITALDDVTIEFAAGSVHAILGENGAGKSTLMKILAGAESADAGVVEVDGAEVHFSSVRDANAQGVAIVFQELSLFPELDVLANLFANREITQAGFIRRRRMAARARPVLKELGLDVRLDELVSALPLHERQLLEIAKALLTNVRVLVLDEPSSSLSANETARLLSVVRELKNRGVTVLLVSHRLEEIAAIADTVTVLRNGRLVKTVPMDSTDMATLVADMIGRAPGELPFLAMNEIADDAPRLTLSGVSTNRLQDVTLEARQGEILGLAGLEDAGVQEVLTAIYGGIAATSGSMTFPDGNGQPRSMREAVRRGIALVPADRRRDGLMLQDSVLENVSSVRAGVTGGYRFWLRKREMRARADETLARLRVKFGRRDDAVGTLSGGNQQKIVLGKWLQVEPSVLLLDDPTRGVDLGAKLEIYEVIKQQTDQGKLVIFSSSELEEYRHLCRRVIIFRRGRIARTLVGAEVSEHNILQAMNLDPVSG
ncbi:sugar ABC transporter ATP-binding protein [Microbacterium sp. ARD31]|uniref:sugar ABC transporter ATP-binding protein n=1 Tax=Microbacterium sp. ARD31 TaxID=2962576 RepID=UPI002881715D|nr:sugar ABC transporter ATP-binding protein [Microbacterium sp. ARD31]MDT0183992.1 sugar ABC transporter ATP-binding protein [Microbacterium sp. ARD31]